MAGTQHALEFLAQPVEGVPSGICPLFGSERFLKRLVVEHLVNAIGEGDPDFVPTEFESDTATWADVHDELSTRTLFGGDGLRVVIVDHANKFVTAYRSQLEDYLAGKGVSGLLILLLDAWPANTKLYKAIHKKGLQVKCDPPMKGRSKNRDDSAIQQWLIARAKAEYGFTLPAGGAQLLIDVTDAEFGRMDQELQKLELYADQGKIAAETIKQVVGGWRSRTMWEIIDAATDGEGGKAIELMGQLFRSGEHPLGLFGQMSWSLRRYAVATEIVMRQMRSGRRPHLPDALKSAGFFAWNNELKLSEGRLRQLGSHRTGQMMDWLLDADLALKRSHSQADRGRLVLETLFVKMTKELGK